MADCDKIRPRLLKPPEIVHFTGWLIDVGDEGGFFRMWELRMMNGFLDVDVFYCLDVDWWLLILGF